MIRFVGDINLTDNYFDVGFGIGSKLSAGVDPLAGLLNRSVINIGNFEGVASDISRETGYNSKVFRITTDDVSRIHHFEYYGLANNHSMQHGTEAFNQTVRSLSHVGCTIFGTNAHKSVLFSDCNRLISITGVSFRIDDYTKGTSYWHNPEYKEIIIELESLPKDAYKILFVHWGNEFIDRPSSSQKKLAHWLIDSGFDLIIGMHPHIIQGWEEYMGKRIYYSLGNFVFDMPYTPCKYGLSVLLEFSGEIPVFLHQYVHIVNGIPSIVDEMEVPENCRLAYLNQQLKIDDNPENYNQATYGAYKKYKHSNRRKILLNIIRHPMFGYYVILDFIKRKMHIF